MNTSRNQAGGSQPKPFRLAANSRQDRHSRYDFLSPKKRALRDGEANCFGNFQIDNELELRRLLQRQVAGLCASEYLTPNWEAVILNHADPDTFGSRRAMESASILGRPDA